MSNETAKPSAASTAVSYLAFPVITTGAGAISSIKNNKGIKGAISSCRASDFKKLQGNLSGDCFTKAIEVAENYDKYKELTKNARKLAKKAGKTDISLLDKFFNLFRKQENKVTIDTIRKKSSEAQNALKNADAALKNGKVIVEEVAEKGFKQNAAKVFKSEIKNPFVIFFTALEAVPEVTGKIIPTFQNEGFLAGIKQTGKSILKIGANFVSYAAGSALGKVVGAAIGSVICPGVGSAVGAKVGDMIGSMFIGSNVTKVVNKVIGEEEKPQTNEQQIPVSEQIIAQPITQNERLAQRQSSFRGYNA